jgi:mersacidin/lichenicidin family type 2 lantibiotic
VNVHDIIRAWKDQKFREDLKGEEKTKLPENPAGEIELFDEEMTLIAGGWSNGLFCVPSVDLACQK